MEERQDKAKERRRNGKEAGLHEGNTTEWKYRHIGRIKRWKGT
jgi:hypothetical protein